MQAWCCHHINQPGSTLLLSQPVIPHCNHNRREESLLFTTDCQQLDPCNLEKYQNVTGRSFPVALLHLLPSYCTSPSRSLVFTLLRLEDIMNETEHKDLATSQKDKLNILERWRRSIILDCCRTEWEIRTRGFRLWEHLTVLLVKWSLASTSDP